MQPLPKYPLHDKDVGINDVLGPWINAPPAKGQWRHPFHILWVDGQTNKNCPACRYHYTLPYPVRDPLPTK